MDYSTHLIRRPWLDALSSSVLFIAWLWANFSALEWLYNSLSTAPLFNQAAAGFLLVLLLATVWWQRICGKLPAALKVTVLTPQVRSLPLLLMLGSLAIAIALKWLFDLPQLQVLLFTLGTYGLCGLFLEPDAWRRNLPAAALAAVILPFTPQLGTGLGLPARVLSAHLVERSLSAWHIAAISSHDIIVLENGIAHIDSPCSGLKSLWSGTLFLLAATWLENRSIGWRWLFTCGVTLFALFTANVLRVLILVLVANVFSQPRYAEILHVPLGLFGFICGCALAWFMLQQVPKRSHTANLKEAIAPLPKPQTLSLSAQTFLIATLISLALLSQFSPNLSNSQIATIHWPENLLSQSIPLTTAEQKFFSSHPPLVAEKRRFTFNNLSGSALIVANISWKSYHAPELCYIGSGLKVDKVENKQISPTVAARWLSLQDNKLSASYWLQSPKKTTADFFNNFWNFITGKQETWVLVSVLFDRSLNFDRPDVRDFANTIYEAVRRSFPPVTPEQTITSNHSHNSP